MASGAINSEKRAVGYPQPIHSVYPTARQKVIKWNGWGYKDSKFEINNHKGVRFTGQRYNIGDQDLPHFAEWIKKKFDVDLDVESNKSKDLPRRDQLPEPKVNQDLVNELISSGIAFSTDAYDRLDRSHGHALQDIFYLRNLDFSKLKLPDLVVWPTNNDQVVFIVNSAKKHNVAIIPFGGGTNVSWAVCVPEHEQRLVISLDTTQMNRLLWLDKENLVACFEAGIIGQDLERTLKRFGLTCGHEPDSIEFSSLGGWVATRASGMKKNTYGNIEDILVFVKMVTPAGIIQKRTQVPRLSCGPDFNHIILGSEGTLGVVTEVAIKVRPVPEVRKYGSLAFPDFESGYHFMREVARQRCQPSSIRLMDNEQFKFGHALRPSTNFLTWFVDGLKKAYITQILRFNVNDMCVVTLLFEGDKTNVAEQEKRIYKIASKFHGVPSGEKNGLRGYTLTFIIAYIRDLALDFSITAESFETSVPWDRTLFLVNNVKYRIGEECKKRGIKHYLISARITQTYDAGCCIYFYFGFLFKNIVDPMKCYHEIEIGAREEILAAGGSISHHHGIGKIRAPWYQKQVSETASNLYLNLKHHLDPQNIFAAGNILPKCKL